MFLLSGFHGMHCQLWQNRGLTSQVQYLGHPQARLFVLKSGMNILDIPAVFICFPHHSHFLCCSMLFPAIFNSIFCRFAASFRVAEGLRSQLLFHHEISLCQLLRGEGVQSGGCLDPRDPRSWQSPNEWQCPTTKSTKMVFHVDSWKELTIKQKLD